MLIGLIRHGLTDWNAVGRIQGQSDIPLNDEGRGQAELLATRLKQESYKWDFVVTSQLSRALETGQIIADELNIPLYDPDSRILEKSFGKVEGLTSAERETLWGKDWDQLELGQEKNEQIQKRALDFMEDIARRFPDKNILVISHGGLLAQLYVALFQDKYNERIGNLSFTVVENQQQNWIMQLYNCTHHLENILK